MMREYLSNIDSVMLQLEDPANLMMPTAVMVFEEPLDPDRLKSTIEVRLLGTRRFRQRLRWSRLGRGRAYWEDDPRFDINYHFQHATLSPPGDQAALQEIISLLTSTPLDLSRPPWQVHLIKNYAECCALVIRVHHAIGDGVSLMHMVLSLTDSEPGAPWPTFQPKASRQHSGHRLTSLLRPARQALGSLVREGPELLAHPSRLRDAGYVGREAAADLGRFLLLKPDPKTVLRGELGVNKRAAWSAGIPLEEVKTIQQALGGTVNDVLMAVVTGALRHYMKDRGEPVDGISIRVTVPVNVRPPDREPELGNQVGAVFVPLPVGIADPVCRLGEVVRRMNGRKDSYEAPMFYLALNVLGQAPGRIANTLINTFSTRASAVLTNVKGPQEQLYLAGVPLKALLPWAPTTGHMGVAISILSYAGHIRLGVLTDEGLVPDPERIVQAFHDEHQALLARALEAEQRN